MPNESIVRCTSSSAGMPTPETVNVRVGATALLRMKLSRFMARLRCFFHLFLYFIHGRDGFAYCFFQIGHRLCYFTYQSLCGAERECQKPRRGPVSQHDASHV